MLQQTQIVTALPYYERWMARFPTVKSLADSSLEDALSLWQGLGYYRRCRMLHEGAKVVAQNGIPQSHDEWIKIPGVGSYTAAAISSICYGEPVAVVDGNVERVVARLTCDPANDAKLKTNSWKWAKENLYAEDPGDWNQAVMELGAMVCKPSVPVCQLCPITKSCRAFRTKQVDKFPTPKTRQKTIERSETIWVAICSGKIAVVKSHDLDWWKGLSLLPISSTHPDFGKDLWSEDLGEIRYTVTHHKIRATINLVRTEGELPGLEWVELDKINEVPLPAPHRKALALLYKT